MKILTCLVINTKNHFTEMDNSYHCTRTSKIMDELISKTKCHICKTILLRRELKLPVTPSVHLFKYQIFHQMKNIVGGLADKNEYHIKRNYQDGKRSERIYCGLTIFQQLQISQLKCNDLMTNPQVKLKSEQIKHESKINLKRKR